MDETFNAERAARLFYYALRNRNADVVGLALKAARAAGEPAGKLLAAAAAGEGVEWWNVSALLVKAAEYGETPAAAYFDHDKKLKQALGDAAKTIGKRKASGTFQRLDLGLLTKKEEALARLILGDELGEDDVAEVVELIGHSYEGVRTLALSAVAARPGSADLLFSVIEDKRLDPVETCRLLGELRDPRGVPHVARLLRQEAGIGGAPRRYDLRLLKEAVAALRRIGDEQSVLLLSSLTGEQGAGAGDALKSLGRRAAPVLLRVYGEEPRWRREEAVLLAEVAGAEALDVLLEALRDRYRAVRENAEEGLVKLGRSAVAPLLSLLASADPTTRIHAARVLGKIGDAAAFEPLARMTRSRDARDWRAAVGALSGFSDEKSLVLLAGMSLRSPEREMRRAAVAALGRRRDVGAAAVVALARAFADGERVVRLEAVDALAKRAGFGVTEIAHSPEAHVVEVVTAAGTLTRFLRDEDAEVVKKASDALLRIGEPALKPVEDALQNATGEHADRLKDLRERISRAEGRSFLSRLKYERALRGSFIDFAVLDGGEDRERLGDPAAEGSDERWAALTTGAPPITDSVHFTVTAPQAVAPGESFVLDVWAHTEAQRQRVLERARKAGGKRGLRERSKGPLPVGRGGVVTVRLSVPALGFEDEDTLYWMGEAGNCNFAVRVPPDAPPGFVAGTAYMYLGGASLTRLHFELEVGALRGEADDLVTREERIRSAFASYASEERELVLAGLQGLSKARPDLDVFVDVVTLRSGERWAERLAEEIPKRDVLYLFWSRAASRSEWVEKEWRAAYEAKGVDGVDPFPLEPQGVAPAPPDELKSLHFNDPLLGFRRPAK